MFGEDDFDEDDTERPEVSEDEDEKMDFCLPTCPEWRRRESVRSEVPVFPQNCWS